MIKKKANLMKRRAIAIAVAVVLVVVLAVALAIVLDYVNATSVEDPADGTVYYVREKDDVYALYDTDKKTVMPTESQYGYYVTHAGTLIRVDAETGEYEIIAAVDTEYSEKLDFNRRVLIFPHIEMENILRLDVSNEHGNYSFVRMNIETGKPDMDAEFIIEGSPMVQIDQDLFSSLYVAAGYTLTTRKIEDPIKDENGEFSEYGLVPEHRVREVKDDDGEFDLNDDGSYKYEEYEYVPAHYVLTDGDGNRYKLIIGDRMVTGGGYYVQYVDVSGETEVKRDAVYTLSTTIGETALAPVEDYVLPQLTYGASLNNYFDVEKFRIMSKNPNATGEDDLYDASIIGFDYVDIAERQNTIYASQPYYFLEGFGLDGYAVSSDNVDRALMGLLYNPALVKVAKLAPTLEDFVKYGIFEQVKVDEDGEPVYDYRPEHVVMFNSDMTDDDGNVIGTMHQRVYISAITEDNTRHAFTEVYSVDANGKVSDEPLYDYGMIVEVEAHSLEFLNWDRYDWINAKYINLNIAFCKKITVSAPGYSATFELDNSATPDTGEINTERLSVHATDSAGNDRTTFSQLIVIDKNGNVWDITARDIKCYSSAGTELKIKSAYYSYNSLDDQVRSVDGYIDCADGSRVYVDANEVRVVTGDGTQTYVRYETDLFRQFYQTLIRATISDSYELSESEKQTVPTDANLMLTMTVEDSNGETKTYQFYKLTSRKAYITVNGNGGFYVLNNRVQKFITDSQRFFAGEMIDSTAKN